MYNLESPIIVQPILESLKLLLSNLSFYNHPVEVTYWFLYHQLLYNVYSHLDLSINFSLFLIKHTFNT